MDFNLWLAWELTKREVSQRYRGTFLGFIWPILYSALFLAIFSFVFTYVLKVRWDGAGGPSSGALMIFCGLVPYLFIAEVIGRSPTLMLGSQNLVKRVRFPLELIPVATVNAALLLATINVVLLLGFGFLTGKATISALLFFPLILLPLYLFALGAAWFFSAITVFFRDVTHIAPVIVQVLMFMAPVFYPASLIPEEFQPLVALNPLTYFVEAFRTGLTGGFDGMQWLHMVALHACLAGIGRLTFHRLRPAFGDLL